jgi:hypothetical protein
MTRQLLVSTLALTGIILIVLGVSWNSLFPPSTYWSDEQTAEYNAAFNAVHTAQDAHLHRTAPDHKVLVEARERYLSIRGELERAQQARTRGSKLATVAGLLLLLSAVIVRRYWRPEEENFR